MKITLPHKTTQANAISKIDQKLNEAMNAHYAWVTIVDPEKRWDNNILRGSFTLEKGFIAIDFKGMAIVTDQEVIGEADLPAIVTTFISEDRIREVIIREFNKLFNI
jgi:hypothetical protein